MAGLARRALLPVVCLVAVLGLAFAATLGSAGGGVAILAGTESSGSAACAAPAGSTTALDAEQLANAQVIMATGARLGVPARGQVVAIATALQESGLRNLDHGDRDSLGLFQQRAGWGTVAARMDPATAAAAFYRVLVTVPGWQSLPVTVAAQRVQRSAYPDAYARWEATALAVVGTGATCEPTTVQPVALTGDGKGRSDAVPCPTGTPGRVDVAPGGVPIQVCPVGPMEVNARVAGNVAAMLAAAKAAGLDLGGSAFRSTARQIELRRAHCRGDVFTAPSSSCSPPTAPPGKSMHEWGLALDLTCSGVTIGSHGSPCFVWLAANAGRYGFRNLPVEPWHWSTSGS